MEKWTCSTACFGSPGQSCPTSGGGANAIVCKIFPYLDTVTNASYGTDFHNGQPIILWGYGFQPNGSVVAVWQNGRLWQLPGNNNAYWWNGNTTQINTVITNSTGVGQWTGVTVWANGGASESRWFYVLPN
jgi:hypothetical protein